MSAELPAGISRAPRPAKGHMPFPGHRTQQQVREDAERYDQLPWCPSEYRQMFRTLRGKCGGQMARRLIEEQISVDARRSSNVLIAERRGCESKSK